MEMDDVAIVAAGRTAAGKFGGRPLATIFRAPPMPPKINKLLAALIAAFFAASMSSGASAQDADTAQIREQLKQLEARLQAVEKQLKAGSAVVEARQTIQDARAQYTAARGKAGADYRAKTAECDKQPDDAKKACIAKAKAARNKAIADANAALDKVEDGAAAKIPDLDRYSH